MYIFKTHSIHLADAIKQTILFTNHLANYAESPRRMCFKYSYEHDFCKLFKTIYTIHRYKP